MKTALFGKNAKIIGEIELPSQIFDQKSNPDLVYQVVNVLRGNQRQVLAHTKGRSEVRGGGKKPWAQKGTGRARHGSIRSPIWKGGGVTHGPRKERVFKRKVNQKMKQKALSVVLSEKARRGYIKIIENLEIPEAKTKTLMDLLKPLLANRKTQSAIVLSEKKDEKLEKAARNIQYLKVVDASNVNVLDLLNYKFVIMTPGSLDKIKERVK
ncbi:MAG: 50S ribosomal protein L4 [Candidatus Paceibacteria bacterium]